MCFMAFLEKSGLIVILNMFWNFLWCTLYMSSSILINCVINNLSSDPWPLVLNGFQIACLVKTRCILKKIHHLKRGKKIKCSIFCRTLTCNTCAYIQVHRVLLNIFFFNFIDSSTVLRKFLFDKCITAIQWRSDAVLGPEKLFLF